MKLARYLVLPFFWISAVSVAQSNEQCEGKQTAFFLAAYQGDVEKLSDYRRTCSLNVRDARAFSLYDIAASAGNGEVLRWLENNHQAKSGQYSVAFYKRLQTGLRFLQFDAGIIDGKWNKATQEAVIAYKKEYQLGKGSQLDAKTLRHINQALVRKTQRILTDLGYNAGGTDGVIGANTIKSMQQFRRDKSITVPDYAYIDDQLIYQLMMAENDANKLRIAKRDKAVKEKSAKEQAAREKAAKEKAAAQKQQAKANQEKLAKEKAAKEKAAAQKQQAKLKQEKLAKERAAKEKVAKEQAAKARQAQSQEAKVQGVKRSSESRSTPALPAATSEKNTRVTNMSSVTPASEKQVASASAPAPLPSTSKVEKRSSKGGFNHFSGVMRFTSSTQCSVGSTKIEASWCQNYYPEKSNKPCDVVLAKTGKVISLLCK